MANDIDDSFVEQFEDEVHIAYQDMGTKLINTVRRKTNVTGDGTTFQKLGNGTAGPKSRNGDVPIFNQDHDPIKVALEDTYSGQYIDKLDELKLQHDERRVTVVNQSAAMGRKSDDHIIAAHAGLITSNKSAATTGTLDRNKVAEAYEYIGENDVPEDDEWYLAVSIKGWTDLMDEPEFSDADYVGQEGTTYNRKMLMKEWFGFKIFKHTRLSKSGNVRSCMAYHKSALGHASGKDVSIDLTWEGIKQAHLSVACMSEGAIGIDANGAFQVDFTE